MNMEENNSKEINLLQLIGSVVNWFVEVGKSVLTLIGDMIRLSYRHKIVTGIVLVVCISYGQYLCRPSARVYNVEAMALLYGSDAQTVKEISKQLENTLSTNNQVSFATKLSLPDSVAKNIVGFNSYYVIDYLKDGVADKVDFANNHSLTDTLNVKMRDRLYFQIRTRNIRQIGQVQAAILNYFNKNDVLNTQYQMEINELVARIKVCDREYQRIDSLAKVSYFKDADKGVSFENNKLFVGEQKKQLFYGDLIHLHDVKTSAETRLAICKRPVELPSDFVVNPNPINSRGKYGVYSIIMGYALALLIVILIDNLKKIKTFLDK
jgi:hypothetical protein